MKKSGYIFLLAIMLFSCNGNKEDANGDSVIDICLDDKQELKKFENWDLIKDTKIVQLSSEKIIGNIGKICSYDTLLYILDDDQRCVHIFGTSGRYLNTISHLGHGPGEYLDIADIFVDNEKSTVNLVSYGSSKIMTYDKEGKQLLQEKKTQKRYWNVEKLHEGYIGYTSLDNEPTEPFMCWSMDEELNIKQKGMEFGEVANQDHCEMDPISTYNGEPCIISRLNYDIYSFDGNNFSLKYRFDFGKYNDNGPLDNEDSKDNSTVDHIERFQETDNYILAYFILNYQEHMVVYDKNTHKTFLTMLPTNTEKKYGMTIDGICGMDESHIYTSLISSVGIFLYDGGYEQVFEKESPDQWHNFRNAITRPNDGDNPLIIIHTIR